MNVAKDLAFWLAVGLAGVVTSAVLKLVAARFRLPRGAEEFIAVAT